MTSVADLLAGQVVTERTIPDDDIREEVSTDAPSQSYAGDRPLCQEPGCERPCRARRNHPGEFLNYCSAHNPLHADESGGSSREPTSRTPRKLTEARKQSAQRIENNVTGWLGMAQMGLATAGDSYCAWAIGVEGPFIAQSLGDLAQDYPLLKKVLETGDKWGSLSVLVYHLSRLGLMVATHHKWIPWEGPIRFLVPQPPSRHTPQPTAPPVAHWDTNQPHAEPASMAL